MSDMTDRTWVAGLLNFTLHGASAPTTPTQPLHLRLMTSNGSNTGNGTELSATGYTAGGASMGTESFGANSSGVSASGADVTWTAGASWPPLTGVEVWDSAGSSVRLLQGAITNITGVGNGDTVEFAAGNVTADGSAW